MNTKETFKVTTSGEREMIMTRVFAASREMIFDAFTKPALVKRWLGAMPGWSMPVCEIDLKVGGAYRWVWRRDDDGIRMGMGGTYREITRPSRLVFTEKFDEAWYPGEAVGTVELVEKGGMTTLTQTMCYESRQARDQVLESEMESGVVASYDRLEEILSQPPAER